LVKKKGKSRKVLTREGQQLFLARKKSTASIGRQKESPVGR